MSAGSAGRGSRIPPSAGTTVRRRRRSGAVVRVGRRRSERRYVGVPAVPRLLLEALFLAAVAAGAALANLDPAVIAAVMAGAWLLVALIEWAASRADRRRDEMW